MKTLCIIRHAQADSTQPDLERSLTRIGQHQAHWVAQQLKQEKIIPDAIFSSPATRALQTAQIVSADLDWVHQIQTDPIIYSGDQTEILALIQSFDTHWKKVFLFGHNPHASNLINLLCQKPVELKNCSIAVITFKNAWQEIKDTVLSQFLTPPEKF
jgi:phosphohistidine phosphatase